MKLNKKLGMELALKNLETAMRRDYGDATYNRPYAFVIEPGRKFIRVRIDGSGVWGFVEVATGDIYKAATWRAPAKHVRGNVFDESTWTGFAWTGPQYLR